MIVHTFCQQNSLPEVWHQFLTYLLDKVMELVQDRPRDTLALDHILEGQSPQLHEQEKEDIILLMSKAVSVKMDDMSNHRYSLPVFRLKFYTLTSI